MTATGHAFLSPASPLNDRNDKRWKFIPPGTFAGKKIIVASTQDVDANAAVAAAFMSSIFGLDPAAYALSDESDVLDFVPFGERNTEEV